MIRNCIILLFLGVTLGHAQPLRIEYFTVNDGLSTRDINDLHIGQDGFLWVATMDGLNRFDGQGFLSFGQGTASEGGLSRGGIAAVAPDQEGQFIIKFRDFYGYFDRFNPKDFSVEQVRMVPSTGVLGYPRAITTDALGRTFVVTIGTEGTFIYEYTPTAREKEQFTSVYHNEEDSWTTLAPRIELLVLRSGEMLLYDEAHGFRLLSATGGKVLEEPFKDDFDRRRFYTFAEGADEQVYFSFRSGPPLYRWSPERGYPPIAVENLDYGLVYPRIFRDKVGQLLLLATEDILGAHLPEEYYLVDTFGAVSLFEDPLPTNRQVSAMTALNFRETVYLGLREGLGVVERYVNPVTTFLSKGPDDVLSKNNMRGICEDNDGRMYFMEEEGVVYYLDPGEIDLKTLDLVLAEDTTSLVNFRAGAELLYDQQLHALWGTAQRTNPDRGGLLFRYDIGTETTRTFHSKYALGAMCFGPDGMLYLAGSDPREIGVLLSFDRATQKFQEVTEAGGVEKVAGFRINYLLTTSSGVLLLGTENRGLGIFDLSLEELSFYDLNDGEEEEQVRRSQVIHVIHEDSLSNWWLGTESGLYRYERSTGDITAYGRQEGLSNNIVYGIIPDSTGGFWLSTQNGLTRMMGDFQQGSFRRYYQEDGLSNDQFNRFSFYRSKQDGRYCFGGINGLTVFQESDLASSSAGADVMLTEITVFGREEERKIANNLAAVRQVTVLPQEKGIAISFALPAGQLPSSSQFRYRLDGFNDDWINLTNERTIRFNNLRSGNYTLRIQGAGANGNFGNQETRLFINVRQYIIEKLWFQIIVVVAFAGLLLFIIQARLRERLRNEQLRTQLSSDLHDEVSGLLAGITLQAELLKNRTEDESLKSRLDRVGEAGRNAMSKMSDVIWSIDSRRDTIGNLLQRMQEHADEVLLPLDIRYDFRATGFDNSKELPGNIRQDVYFIFKEAVNNIARHSNATRVQIELVQVAQVFELFIRDNGSPMVGSATEQSTRGRAQKSGQGKDNMRMRAERLKGELTIDHRKGYTLVFRMKRLG